MGKIEWVEAGGFDVAVDEQGQQWQLIFDREINGRHVALIEREGMIATVINGRMIISA